MKNLLNKKLFLFGALILILVMGVVVVTAQGPSGSGWWTGFTLQNIDSDADPAINVIAEAYLKQGQTDPATKPKSVVKLPEDVAVTFNPGFSGTCGAVASAGCRIAFSPDLPSDFEGSVVVSSDGPAVAIVQVNNNPSGSVGVSGGSARAGYQGTGAEIADTTLIFPTVKNNFAGQTTALYVQAAGGSAPVNIEYRLNDGSTKNQSTTIDANKTYVFMPSAAGVPSCNGGNQNTCIGGATVTSTGAPIAGTVVEFREGVSVAEYVLSTRGLVPSDTGPVIVAPTMKNNFFGGTTGASIYNADTSSPATVDLKFTVTNTTPGCSVSIGDVKTDQVTIPPLSSVVVSKFQNNIGSLPACTFFAMTASTVAHGGEDIAATVNESRTSGSDTFKAVYSAFNSGQATDLVFFPLVKEAFFNQTTGLAIVNVDATETTKVNLTYSGSTGTHVLETTSALDPGEAVSVREAYKSNSKWTAVSGGLPKANNKYAVTVSPVNANAVLVGLAQEATVSGTALDVYNVEGFNQ